MRSTTQKCALPSPPRRLLLALASVCWLAACGDDDPKPPSDFGPDAATTGDTHTADAAASDDTSSTRSTDTSETPSGTSSGDTDDAGLDGGDDGGTDVTRDASGSDESSSTGVTSSEATSTQEASSEASTDEASTGASTDDSSTDVSDAGVDAGDAAGDAAADGGDFPWDAATFAIGRDEVRVLTDFATDGDQSDGISIIAPDVGVYGPLQTIEGLLFEIADSIGRFTVPFTDGGQALRIQFPLSGNYATHNLRARLRIVEALPNNPGATPTLQLFTYSGGGQWNSLGLTIELGVWREYTYDLWTQPVAPEALNSAGFRVGTGNVLTEPDSFVVEVDWIRLEPKP